ncbi:MAG: lipase secretion chaperone [Gammaproteobacteria bacterium]
MIKKLLLASAALTAVGLILAGFALLDGHRDRDLSTSDPTAAEVAADDTIRDPLALRPASVLERVEKPSAEVLRERYEAFMANRPLYLADTDLPAQYNVDADGNLVVDGNVKDLLDYFLLTIGDLPFDEIYDLIAGNMIASLQEPALSQALAVLDKYFAYIDAYDQWESSFDKSYVMENDPAGMRDRLAELENLRRQYLGDEAYDAFFAELDQTNNAYLEAQLALQQPGLSDQQRTVIIDQLKAALPEPVRQAQEAAMTQVNLAEYTETLRKQGATDAQIYQARVDMVGEDAAKRLAQVDEEKRQWQSKREQYKALLSESGHLDGLATADRNAYIVDLAQRELGLTSNEIKRMQALDRIEAAESIQ